MSALWAEEALEAVSEADRVTSRRLLHSDAIQAFLIYHRTEGRLVLADAVQRALEASDGLLLHEQADAVVAALLDESPALEHQRRGGEAS